MTVFTDLRYGLAIVMAALAVLGSGVGAHAWFTRQTLYDTDRFVEATMEVIGHEAVQEAIAENVTEAVFASAGVTRPDPDEADESDETDGDGTDETDGTESQEPDGADASSQALAGASRSQDSSDSEDPASEDPASDDPAGEEGGDEEETGGLVIPGIAEAIEGRATDITVSVLQSGRLDRALESAVRDTHEELLQVIDNDFQETVTIDLDPVLRATLDQLANDPALSFLDDLDVPAGSARFVVAREGQGGGFWWTLLRNYDGWATQTVIWTIVLLALALVISPERDRILLGTGTGFLALALLNIGLLFAIRKLAAGVFIRDEVARGAFDDVSGSLASPLVSLEIRIAVIGAVMAAVGGALGFYITRFRGERVFGSEPQHVIPPAGYHPYQQPYPQQPYPQQPHPQQPHPQQPYPQQPQQAPPPGPQR